MNTNHRNKQVISLLEADSKRCLVQGGAWGAHGLSQIARTYTRANFSNEAMSTLSKAQELLEEKKGLQEAVALINIAEAYYELKEVQLAQDPLEKATHILRSHFSPNKAVAWAHLARIYFEFDRAEEGEQTLRHATKLAMRTEGFHRGEALLEIAGVHRCLGSVGAAEELLDQVKEIAIEEEDLDISIHLLGSLVVAYHELEMRDKSLEVLTIAMDCLTDSENIMEVAQACVEIGQREQSKELVERAIAEANEMANVSERILALGKIAVGCAKMGEEEYCLRLLKRVEERASFLPVMDAIQSFLQVARALLCLEDNDGAVGAVERALSAVQSGVEEPRRGQMLREIRDLFADAEAYEKAEEVGGVEE